MTRFWPTLKLWCAVSSAFVEDTKRTTCHIVIKILVKFTLVGLHVIMDTFYDLLETLYNFSDFFESAFKQYMVMNKQNAECSHFCGPLAMCNLTKTFELTIALRTSIPFWNIVIIITQCGRLQLTVA